MDEKRVITESMGKKMGEALGCNFYETSAKIPISKLSGYSNSLIRFFFIYLYLIK